MIPGEKIPGVQALLVRKALNVLAHKEGHY